MNSPASVPASLGRKNRTDRSMQFQYMDEFFVSSLGVFQNEDMCILIHVWMETIELGRSQPHISASKGKKHSLDVKKIGGGRKSQPQRKRADDEIFVTEDKGTSKLGSVRKLCCRNLGDSFFLQILIYSKYTPCWSGHGANQKTRSPISQVDPPTNSCNRYQAQGQHLRFSNRSFLHFSGAMFRMLH